ncbi:hypothetical protein CTAYLR_007308 [Chrysophaeum taylorii]|uniref:VWFA domain-containing protein n=1 Tax=Chrysophaeum taylorii TaxID=2483200 RepID=A0AAD7UIX1_9STRA|nr:hypothetical protein CTAYLR_007308 [Chrysophaeum taylorii]
MRVEIRITQKGDEHFSIIGVPFGPSWDPGTTYEVVGIDTEDKGRVRLVKKTLTGKRGVEKLLEEQAKYAGLFVGSDVSLSDDEGRALQGGAEIPVVAITDEHYKWLKELLEVDGGSVIASVVQALDHNAKAEEELKETKVEEESKKQPASSSTEPKSKAWHQKYIDSVRNVAVSVKDAAVSVKDKVLGPSLEYDLAKRLREQLTGSSPCDLESSTVLNLHEEIEGAEKVMSKKLVGAELKAVVSFLQDYCGKGGLNSVALLSLLMSIERVFEQQRKDPLSSSLPQLSVLAQFVRRSIRTFTLGDPAPFADDDRLPSVVFEKVEEYLLAGARHDLGSDILCIGWIYGNCARRRTTSRRQDDDFWQSWSTKLAGIPIDAKIVEAFKAILSPAQFCRTFLRAAKTPDKLLAVVEHLRDDAKYDEQMWMADNIHTIREALLTMDMNNKIALLMLHSLPGPCDRWLETLIGRYSSEFSETSGWSSLIQLVALAFEGRYDLKAEIRDCAAAAVRLEFSSRIVRVSHMAELVRSAIFAENTDVILSACEEWASSDDYERFRNRGNVRDWLSLIAAVEAQKPVPRQAVIAIVGRYVSMPKTRRTFATFAGAVSNMSALAHSIGCIEAAPTIVEKSWDVKMVNDVWTVGTPAFASLDKIGSLDQANAFHVALFDALAEKLATPNAPSLEVINGACAVLGASNLGSTAKSLASRALVRHCELFWPRTADQVIKLDAQHFEPIFALVGAGTLDEMLDHTARFRELVATWADHIRSCDVVGAELRELLKPEAQERVKALVNYGGPEVEDLKAMLSDREDQINIAMEASNFRSDNRSVAIVRVLDRRAVQSESLLDTTLRRYAADDESCSPGAERFDALALRIIREDAEHVQTWRHKYAECLKVIEYFSWHASSLFEHYLGRRRGDSSSAQAFDAFVVAVNDAKTDLAALFRESGARFEDLRDAAARMRNIDDELRTIAASLDLVQGDVDLQWALENIIIVLQLAKLANPCTEFLECLRQYGFACVSNGDENFAHLEQVVHMLQDNNRMKSAGVYDCRRLAMQLKLALGSVATATTESTPNDEDILSYLGLFETLAQSADVWKLVREKQWIGVEGLRRFNDEYENVTNLLQGEAYESDVLDELDPAVRYISVLSEYHGRAGPAELLSSLRGHRVMSEVGRKTAFRELDTIQRNISQVRIWFTRGMGDMGTVFDQFRAIVANGNYRISSAHGDLRLSLAYKPLANTGHIAQLSGPELEDMITRLGFVQHDDKARSLPIQAFLAQHHSIRRFAECALSLRLHGHPKFENNQTMTIPVLRRTDAEVADEVLACENMLADCRAELDANRSRFPLLLLYSTREALVLKNLIQRRPSPGVIVELCHELRRATQHDEASLTASRRAVKRTIKARVEDANLQSLAWPAAVGRFLQDWHMEMGLPPLPTRPSAIPARQQACNGIVIHKIGRDSADLLRLLLWIYNPRLPEGFELLACDDAGTTAAELCLFLQRVRHYGTSRIFSIVYVDRLSTTCQELVVKFLLSCHEADSVNLNCIERGDSTLQPSPWVRKSEWVAQRNTILPSHADARRAYSRLVVGNIAIAEVSVFASSEPSAGKTHAMRKRMDELKATGMHTRVVPVYETCTLATLIRRLHNTTRELSGEVAVCFQVQLGFYTDEDAWLERMSRVESFFYALLVIGCVTDHATGLRFEVPADSRWRVLVELPALRGHVSDDLCRKFIGVSRAGEDELDDLEVWMLHTVPLLYYVGSVVDLPAAYDVDADIRRVCKYLRAYTDGTINRKFNNRTRAKRVCFVIDDSGSMAGHKKAVAADNMLRIFDTHMNDDDMIGLVRFASDAAVMLPLQVIGAAGSLKRTHVRRVIEAERALCVPRRESRGSYIPTTSADIESLNNAFSTAAAMLPVSQTFDLDEYMPPHVVAGGKLLQKHWISYLHRRVKVFDESPEFNYNESHDHLGSTLMRTMLEEISVGLNENFRRTWRNEDHKQLIYDMTGPDGPTFGLISSAPDLVDPKTRAEFEALGFDIPMEVRSRAVLDTYLSRAMGIPLDARDRIAAIDENNFVLTLDFTLKLLSIHERIACNVPCIMEGETGVSKTALTRMYSILMNTAALTAAKVETRRVLESLVDALPENDGDDDDDDDDDLVRRRLEDGLKTDPAGVLNSVGADLLEAARDRGGMYEEPDKETIDAACQEVEDCVDDPQACVRLLRWFAEARLVQLFFELNVHAALAVDDVADRFVEIVDRARRIQDSGSSAKVVVFLDEVNTSSVMGLFKEILIDHSILGKPLPSNVVVIAACNPARTLATAQGGVLRHTDLGKDWASGHYQVHDLPSTLHRIKFNYGSLDPDAEKEFIQMRLEMLAATHPHIADIDHAAMTELVSTSQRAIREFAATHIEAQLALHHASGGGGGEEMRNEATSRAHSVVSLRDIQRVFTLLDFFAAWDTSFFVDGNDDDSRRGAVLLTLAVVYYLRLGPEYRSLFLRRLEELPSETYQDLKLAAALDMALDHVVSRTKIPAGIARTAGLRENVFMTLGSVLVCALSRIPLIIIGPPGSSKTLSVNIITSNAKGEESRESYYRKMPRLEPLSTSTEIESVFKRAIARQDRQDHSELQTLVFMDEAGLPEEEQESLKVLHYYLEGHMSTRSSVSFIAISNHVLDAAKSNRCVCLLRAEPEFAELRDIALGCLFDAHAAPPLAQPVLGLARGVTVDRLIDGVCRAYTSLLKNRDGTVPWFERFFGLRDFIYFLKQLRRDASKTDLFRTSPDAIVRSLERNFNGVDETCFQKIVETFMRAVLGEAASSVEVRSSLAVVADALRDNRRLDDNNTARYKLIIDESVDDSMTRLLQCDGLIDVDYHDLFKLSDFPEDGDVQKVNIVSGVKYACLQGRRVVLSQTEPINEAFYDLFNQHFKSFTGVDGSVRNYANIAIGSLSKPCLVDSAFQCIVHMRQVEVDKAPAPFLNRFEKFRLSQSAVLRATLDALDEPSWLAEVARAAIQQVRDLEDLVGIDGFFGGVKQQTVDSVFVDMFRRVRRRRREGPVEEEKDAAGLSSRDEEKDDSQNIIANLREEVLCLHIPEAASDDVSCQNVVDMARKRLELDGRVVVGDENPFSPWVAAQDAAAQGLEPSIEAQKALATQYLVHVAVARLLRIATPEMIFSNRLALPDWVRRLYYQQEHFDLVKLIDQLGSRGGRHLVFTRTTEAIRSIHNVPLNEESSQTRRRHHPSGAIVVPGAAIVRLTEIQSETALRRLLDTWWRETSVHRILLVLCDMHAVTVNRVNYVRLKVEQIMSSSGGGDASSPRRRTCVLVLHHPSSTRTSGRYPALFLAGWDHIFLDACGGAASAAFNVNEFCQVGCNLRSTWVGPVPSLLKCVPQALRVVASRLQFPNCARKGLRQSTSFRDRVRGLARLLAWQSGGTTLEAILCKRFATIWNSSSSISDELASSAVRIASGESHLPMTEAVTSALLSTFCNYLVLSIVRFDEDMNCDIIADDNIPDEVAALFMFVAARVPVVPVDELKLLNHVHRVRQNALTSPQFPFFSHVSSRMDEIIDAALSSSSSSSSSINVAGNADHSLLTIRDPWTDARGLEQTVRERLTRSIADVARQDDDEDDALSLVAAIEAEVRSKPPELWRRYLEQYVGTRLGSSRDSRALATHVGRWLEGRLDVSHSILSLHVWTRAHRGDVVRIVASLQPLAMMLRDEETLAFSTTTDDDDDDALIGTISAWYVTSLRAKLEDASSFWDSEAQAWMTAFLHFRANLPAWPRLSTVVFENLDRCSVAAAAIASCTDPNHAVAGVAHVLGGGGGGGGFLVEDELLSLLDNFDATFDSRKFRDHTIFWLASPWRLSQCDDERIKSLDGVILSAIAGSRCSPSTSIVVLRHMLTTRQTSRVDGLGFRVSVVNAIEKNLLLATASMTERDVPSYVPAWLASSSSSSCTSKVLPLADALHAVLLRQFLAAHDQASSSQLAIRARQLLRRGASHSPSGTAHVDAIVATATCIVFVARIAREFATETAQPGCINALSSPASAETVYEVLATLMENQSVAWARFFFACLLRQLRDSASLHALLRSASTNSHLSRFEWSRPWFEAVFGRDDESRAETLAAQRRVIAEARTALDGLNADESRKEATCRYCPNCQRVVERVSGCGSMVCGRDFHGNQQQGGCGQAFEWESARRYVKNVKDMQDRANAATRELEIMTARHEFWEEFRAFARSIPTLAVATDIVAVEGPLVPCASLSATLRAASSNDDDDDHDDDDDDDDGMAASSTMPEEARRREQILAFVEVRVGLRHLAVLPALIELYGWFTEHLDHLLTREMAMVMPVGELFSKLAPPRFARSTCERVGKLWDRAKVGYNRFAKSQGYRIGVGACAERAERPGGGGANRLDPITDETPVARLLSDDEDELGGNDCLFVVIRRMIEMYNASVSRVASEDLPEIQPEVISHGNLMVGDLLPFEIDFRDRTYFDSVVEASWDPATESFDTTFVFEAMRTLYVSKCTRVADPMSLRRVFNFRAAAATTTTTTTASAADDGETLATAVLLALDRLDVKETADLEASLRGMFYAASFAQLRGLLLGLKMVVDVLSQQEPKAVDSNDNASAALRRAADVDLLELVPAVDQNQTTFFAQMRLSDLRALASFVRGQLEVEAFNFAHLPVRLHVPLPEGTEATLRLFAAPQLDALDASLAHAERDIAAKADDGPLRDYLVAVGGYDSADPVLAAVTALRFQNYVPLRLALQRLREAVCPPAEMSRRKWSTLDDVSIVLPPSRRLWFEPSAEETNARTIQRSWRAKRKRDSRKAEAAATLVAFFGKIKKMDPPKPDPPTPPLDARPRPSRPPPPPPPPPVRRRWPRNFGVLLLVLFAVAAAFAPRARRPPPPPPPPPPPEDRLSAILSKCEAAFHEEVVVDMADMLNRLEGGTYASNPASARQQRAAVRLFLGDIKKGPAARFVPQAAGPDAAVDLFAALRKEWLAREE